ncbi:hypothetical protein BJY01DRAFT_192295 [Aspergillus pseudoustus]|uniref:Uncharacterized protein n=1 Tax=Aspergillus pseudoustus TaxID=1810923 RepID=A0ABR4JUD1_9EURO
MGVMASWFPLAYALLSSIPWHELQGGCSYSYALNLSSASSLRCESFHDAYYLVTHASITFLFPLLTFDCVISLSLILFPTCLYALLFREFPAAFDPGLGAF